MGKHAVEHIACLTDLTANTLPAFHHALALAVAVRSKLTLLHIGPEHNDEIDWSAFPRVRDTLAQWGRLPADADKSAVARELGVDVRKQAFRDGSLLQGLRAFMRQHHTDLVVACTTPGIRVLREAGVEGMLRDNLGHLLALPAGKPGFVDAETGRSRLHSAVIPVAGQPDPNTAVRLAAQLLPAMAEARPRATLLHVGNRDTAPEIQPDTEAMDWQWVFAKGNVGDAIRGKVAEQQAELLIMPSAGRPGLWQAMRRSQTERLLRDPPCPLLAVASG